MPFDVIEAIDGGLPGSEHNAKASLVIWGKSRKGKVRLMLSVPIAILGAVGIDIKGYCGLAIGTGAQAGIVRILRNPKGPLKGRQSVKGLFGIFNCGHLNHFPNEIRAAQGCKAEALVEDGCVEIVLPDWSKPAVGAQRPEPAPASRPLPPPVTRLPANPRPGPISHNGNPNGARTDLTSSLMGDPPPGYSARRERAEKLGDAVIGKRK